MTSKSDSIGVSCTRLRHFADTFSQWNSCWKKLTLGHMTENKCGYQMHIFVTSFSAQHAPAWRCFCMVQPLRQPFRPKCTNRILQMHHQNPVVPRESGVHPQNPVCTYSVDITHLYPTGAFPKVWTQQWSYDNQASLPDDSLAVPCIGNKVSYLGPNTQGSSW